MLPQGEAHTPVILGEDGDEALLGVVTLEIPGIILDPLKRAKTNAYVADLKKECVLSRILICNIWYCNSVNIYDTEELFKKERIIERDADSEAMFIL